MARGTENRPKKPVGEALWTLRKEEILTEAARLFAERGYSETDTQFWLKPSAWARVRSIGTSPANANCFWRPSIA